MSTTESTDQLVQTPQPFVLFASRRSGLRLTRRPRYPIRDPQTGQVAGVTPGEFIGFRDGTIRVPKQGTFKLEDTLNGGEYEADAEGTLAYLRKHKLYGDMHEGFWEIEVAAPPHGKLELDSLLEAATQLDAGKLEAIIEQERAGWDRAEVIEAAEHTLKQVRELLAAQAEAAEKADAKKPAAKPESKA